MLMLRFIGTSGRDGKGRPARASEPRRGCAWLVAARHVGGCTESDEMQWRMGSGCSAIRTASRAAGLPEAVSEVLRAAGSSAVFIAQALGA
mmetsp:Transcript_11854/g.30410  ORF Transcript_11854/g.30410 Transcript_11854/m.30410 type:complete len:91 (-) Transcript_11854:506-778(-)